MPLGLITHHTSLITAARLLDSPEKVFFAKRTQFQSMFTEDFKKIESQLKPFQTQFKAKKSQFEPN
jgi:hypothetical protein